MQPLSDSALYFAYGSNLDTTQMNARLGRIPTSVVARLPGYRFAFNTNDPQLGQMYANLVVDTGSEVWGVVYTCSLADLESLDDYEDVRSGHYRRGRVVAITRAGEHLEAQAYFACQERLCPERKPSPEYARKILSGARTHGLPPEYIRQIAALAGAGQSLPHKP
jgi:gamma-glutamylcyclotransferase (GGCT)/AIG2-like uncharacterized protein YtfP